MKSILTVVTPANSQDLTILANVKSELGITGTAEDSNIEGWIDQASSVIAGECNRVFGSETVLESFRVRAPMGQQWPEYDKVTLTRSPVTSITTLLEDGSPLVRDTDYECDPDSGILTRLSGDYERRWCFRKLEVTYVAGYALLGTLPEAIERATISLVKQFRSASKRDPLLKSEEIPGVLTQSFWVGVAGEKSNGLPLDVETMIGPYRNVAI